MGQEVGSGTVLAKDQPLPQRSLERIALRRLDDGCDCADLPVSGHRDATARRNQKGTSLIGHNARALDSTNKPKHHRR